LDQLLDIEAAVAERSFRLGARQWPQPLEFGEIMRDAYAAAAAARGRLDHDGETRDRDHVPGVAVAHDAVAAGNRRHACPGRSDPGCNLVAHQPDGVAARADED